MPLVMCEYLEVNLIGVVLLLTMLFFVRKQHNREQGGEQKYFVTMVVLNMLILLADNGIYLLRGHGERWQIILNHGVCVAYFAMHGWFCYCWLRYVLKRLYPRYLPGKKTAALMLLPALAGSFLPAASPVTGWVYTLTEKNVYSRGPLMWSVFLTAILYWTASSAAILKEQRHPSRRRELSEYCILLVFPALLVAGNVLQMKFYGLSIVWICAAISMLILFIDMQNDQLSRDKLTGLFNRRQMNAQLQWEIGRLRTADDLLAVAMFDVDHFKQINDRYGHLSGDQALAAVAGVLKANCRKSDFVCRFGGDEFLLIGHVKNRADAEGIVQRMEDAVCRESRRQSCPYGLSLSAGCTVCAPGDEVTMDAVLNDADAKMYDAKRRKQEAS